MESTWASGASELLRHADSHINLNTAFDKRIAFISIDNCVENTIKTCLSLPPKKSGFKIKKQELDEAGNSFPKLLSLLFNYTSNKLVGIDEADIEHYHRIRNTLYHNGTGLSVDDEYLIAYRDIAVILLNNLFEVSVTPTTSESDSLGRLIINWNTIERDIKEKLESTGLAGTYKWEEAFALGVLEPSDVQLLTELRMARNRLVHSKEIDKEDIQYWLDVSENFIPKIQSSEIPSAFNQHSDIKRPEAVVFPPAEVSITYKKLHITQEIHKYSLSVSVKLLQSPDQDFFRISFLWPAHIPITKINGIEEGEEQNINGQLYQEYAVFVDKSLWPGQTMQVVGDKADAVIEYEFNNKVYMARRQKAFDFYYTLFLQSWQPVQGVTSFDSLSNY